MYKSPKNQNRHGCRYKKNRSYVMYLSSIAFFTLPVSRRSPQMFSPWGRNSPNPKRIIGLLLTLKCRQKSGSRFIDEFMGASSLTWWYLKKIENLWTIFGPSLIICFYTSNMLILYNVPDCSDRILCSEVGYFRRITSICWRKIFSANWFNAEPSRKGFFPRACSLMAKASLKLSTDFSLTNIWSYNNLLLMKG